MPWPFKSKDKVPTLREQVREQTKGEIVRDYASPEDLAPVQFDSQVIDDEKILGLFDPNSPLFCPLVLPLLPLISRVLFLSNCSEKDARVYKLHVDTQIMRLKNRAGDPAEFMLLDSLRGYLHMRINDSVQGFKIRVLTESKKTLTLREEELKKQGWWFRK